MAHTWEDDFAEAKRLRKTARGIANSTLRRRMQSAADKLHLRGIKKVERRFKQRIPRTAAQGRGGDERRVAEYLRDRSP